ncbi:MAG: lamin tail domain-containing protein [Candidatus Thermoplasmatota archaeon]
MKKIVFIVLTILLLNFSYPASSDMVHCKARIGIVINEVLYDPYGNETNEAVELFNSGDSPIALKNWGLTDQDGEGVDFIFPDFVLEQKAYVVVYIGQGENGSSKFYMQKTRYILENTGDDILLLDNNNKPVDYMSYSNGSYVDKPPLGVYWVGENKTASEGKSLGLIPNGYDNDSSSDWYELIPSLGYENQFITYDVVLNELLPNPNSDWNDDGKINYNDSWVELYNKGSKKIDMIDWKISVGNKTETINKTIEPKSFLIFYIPLISSKKIELINPYSIVVDTCNYTIPEKDISYGRFPDGEKWLLLYTPTPLEKNILDYPPVILEVYHVPDEPKEGEVVKVIAKVSDDFSISAVNIFYSINLSEYKTSNMRSNGTFYEFLLLPMHAGTNLTYYIEAFDSRGNKNISSKKSFIVTSETVDFSIFVSKEKVGKGEYFYVWVNLYGCKIEILIGETGSSWLSYFNENYKLEIKAPDIEGEYTIKAYARCEDLEGMNKTKISVLEGINKKPVISDIRVVSNDDVFIYANVADDGIVKVFLRYSMDNKFFSEIEMKLSNGEYFCKLPKQKKGTNVSYYIQAYDGTNSVLSSIYSYIFEPEKINAKLRASLNKYEFEPNEEIKIGGNLEDETSLPLEGKIKISLAKDLWYVETKNGEFSFSIFSPNKEGSYTLELSVYDEVVELSFSVIAIEIFLTAEIENKVVKPNTKFFVYGFVKDKKSLLENVTIYISVGDKKYNGRTNETGYYRIEIRSPRALGEHIINVSAKYMDTSKDLNIIINVKEEKKTPGFEFFLLLPVILIYTIWRRK